MERFDRRTWGFLGLVAFSLLGSALSRALRLDPGPIAPVTAALTLLLGLAAALRGLDPRRGTAVLALGATAEIVGLYTGLPFGRYAYTDRWAPTVPLPGDHRFPLLLPFAWLLVAGSAWTLVPGARWSRAVLTGLGAATVDLVMEPVMAGPLGYWRWLEPGPLPGGAPVLNFVGWALTAALAGGVLEGSPRPSRRGAGAVLGGFLVLTFGLGLILGTVR